MSIDFRQITFLKSAAQLNQLPPDMGMEVAFAGRSNAGKSSAINAITGIHRLARTSKTPGCTQLINLFALSENKRLVDLPGYGYAKVPQATKKRWQETLAQYLENRQCLKGLVLLTDIRHPLNPFDQSMLTWAQTANLPVALVLTKADKLGFGAIKTTIHQVQKATQAYTNIVNIIAFSAHAGTGLNEVKHEIYHWLERQ
jgi:GTP-binding protein